VTRNALGHARFVFGVALALVVASLTGGITAPPAGATPVTSPVTSRVTTPVTSPVTTAPQPLVLPNPAGKGHPTALANGIAQAARLRLQIAANAKRADILDERFLQAQDAVRAADKLIASTQAQIAANTDHVDKLKTQLASRAALLYMGAGNADPIGFNVSSVQELGAMAKYGDAAAARDETILGDLKHTEDELLAQHADLEHQLADATGRRDAARNARRDVARVNASMKTLLATTTATVRLLAAKMEQDAIASASLAEQAWLQRQAKLAEARRAKGGVGAAPAIGDIGGPFGNIPAPSPGALLAVQYAEQQLGKPYVYAGAGPNVFDCSGLTMMAWLQAGVLMTHGSRAQYAAFPKVPLDQLQPGDLVFFGVSGPMNHHVGMVIAPGIMIDAPHTGAFVEIVSYYRSDLVPLGARPQ
jgi:cell wall-associated NlpC family hydrolase